LIDHFGL